MKLIIESWRRFLNEDPSYFGSSFVEFKNRLAVGQHPLAIARDILKPIGIGSTRVVFEFPDNKTHLLKVINVDIIGDDEAYGEDFVNPITGFTKKHKTVSNENEADLKMQQRYPNVFPRTYEHAEDYSWILAERVEPIDEARLAAIFNIPQEMTQKPSRRKYINLMKTTMQLSNIYSKDSSQRSHMEALWAKYLTEDSTMVLDRPTIPDAVETPEERDIRMGSDSMALAIRILKDKHNSLLFRAVSELGIPPRELLAKNLGISKIGGDHLVILDASLWEYEQEPAKAPIADADTTFNL